MQKVHLLLTQVLFLFLFSTAASGQSATYQEVISKKKKGRINIYMSENGEKYKVGDTLTLGYPFANENFDFIFQNAVVELYPLQNLAANSKVVIKKMVARSKLLYVTTTKPQGYVYQLSIINFEGALSSGEVKSKNMTSDQALAELKKWKDKLSLELISQEEYDNKKAELSKFIK